MANQKTSKGTKKDKKYTEEEVRRRVAKAVNKRIEENKKDKKNKGFLNKLWKKASKKKNANKTPILFLKSNGRIESKLVNEENNMFYINGHYYHEREGSDWQITNGKNTITAKIIPEWSNYTMGNKEYIEKLQGDKKKVQKDMTRAIEKARIVRDEKERGSSGMNINPKVAVVVVIAVIVIGYLIFSA